MKARALDAEDADRASRERVQASEEEASSHIAALNNMAAQAARQILRFMMSFPGLSLVDCRGQPTIFIRPGAQHVAFSSHRLTVSLCRNIGSHVNSFRMRRPIATRRETFRIVMMRR